MTYSVDLRKKVVGFVRNGGGQREAARRFEVSPWCVGDWLARKDLQPQQKGVPRQRKLDKEALRAPVRANPDALLRERAAHFGVRISSLEAALKRLRITRKKKTLKYKERHPEKRIAYVRQLRQMIMARGSANLVYVDESGLEPSVGRLHGWSLRGQKVHGEQAGNRRPRQSLIAARRGKDFLAPLLFFGTTNTAWVHRWMEQMLFKELRPNSTLIFDNAAFHNKNDLEAIAHQHGHHILFLPPYSPDLNPIEHDFANLKRQRQFAPPETALAEIIKCYGNYTE